MPFTLAHPAIVLPLRYLPKRAICMTALIIGSMAPDFEYFIRMRDFGAYGHTWAGLVWFDLPLALIVYVIFQYLVKDKLIDHMPAFFNRRFSVYKGVALTAAKVKDLPVIISSILIGEVTHLIWDSFTHAKGQFVEFFPALKEPYHGWYHFYDVLQYYTSAAGLMVIFIVVLFLPRGLKTSAHHIIIYWLIVIIVTAVVFWIRLQFKFDGWAYGDKLISIISGIVIGIFTASIILKDKSTITSN